MSKLIKITAIIMGASMIFISLPSNTEAAWCNDKILVKTERYCENGKTFIKKHYRQDCRYDNGKSGTERWIETDVLGGCIQA